MANGLIWKIKSSDKDQTVFREVVGGFFVKTLVSSFIICESVKIN